MKKGILLGICSVLFSGSFDRVEANTVYETYVELWNCFPSSAPCSICSPVCKLYYGNTYLDMAFASYNGSGGTLSGVQVPSAQSILDISQYVQGSGGGKSKISFGGCTYPIYSLPSGSVTCGLTPAPSSFWLNGQAPTLASDGSGNFQIAVNMAAAINNTAYYGLNGADFDIEQSQSTLGDVPSYQGQPAGATSFAYYVAAILGQVRALCPNVVLSLTVPGQATGLYWETLAQLVIASNAVNYIQFMEYDISVDSTGYSSSSEAYVATIIADMKSYNTTWGIPYNKMTVGLMAGYDDIGNFLTVDGAAYVACQAVQWGLYGVMLWDLDIDYYTYNLAYTNAIRGQFENPVACTAALSSQDLAPTYALTPKAQSSVGDTINGFRERLPPHGSPIVD